jgi:uncharacterized protein (TIGR02145 family)
VIGADTPDPSAMLDVQSPDKGFLPPRMTTAGRNGIASPATGLLIFNTTLNCIEMNVGTPSQPAWGCLSVFNTVTAASSSPTLCINTALTPITHATTGATGIGAATGLPAGVSAAWAANLITISGTPTAAGTFDYAIPLTGGTGNATASGTITVSPANTVGAASATPTVGVNNALTPITHTTTSATGIGAATGLPAGVSAAWAANTITISGTPTESGTFNYAIPLTGGCGSVSAAGTITVTMPMCGAYVAAGVWKTFQCHNLGADATADPFTPSWQLNGHYYLWGIKAVAANGPTGPSSAEANAGVVPTYNPMAVPTANNAWNDASKSTNDPCPTGFRVPTYDHWNAVINTNLNPTRSIVGTWSNSSTNYGVGLRIGSGTVGLFLPAAGYRASEGVLVGRGDGGFYWSSNSGTLGAQTLTSVMEFSSTYAPRVNNINRTLLAYSVRCIAE